MAITTVLLLKKTASGPYGIIFGSCDAPVAYFGLQTQPLSTKT